MQHSPVETQLWPKGPKVDRFMIRTTDGWKEMGCSHEEILEYMVMGHQKEDVDNHQKLGVKYWLEHGH